MTGAQPFDLLYRTHASGIVPFLVRVCAGDLGLAETALHSAFSAALREWPVDGAPDNPREWLARRAYAHALEQQQGSYVDAFCGGALDCQADDYLCLIFACCHPKLEHEERIALTLRWLCNLPVGEIACAQEMSPGEVSARLERARTRIRHVQISYRSNVPRVALKRRLDTVLCVIFSVFGGAEASFGGEVVVRGTLQADAIRLARLLSGLLPDCGEVWALLALMLLLDSRRAARISREGELVMIEQQDRSLWDQDQITEGLACLERALGLGRLSTYALQASVAALHARAPSAVQTNWGLVSLMHGRMLLRGHSYTNAVSYADAVVRAEGPMRGISVIERLTNFPDTIGAHRFHALRGEVLSRLGRLDAAAEEYRAALRCVVSEPERLHLQRRLRELTN
jgi:RNA polymerase sigma-70 factor, ECF subfamily